MSKEELSVSKESVEKLYKKLNEDAEASGYHLNPDEEHTKELVEGLLVNEKRYGYWACPCRLATGRKNDDLDIICPCDYRDADLNEFDTCYCGLYVGKAVVEGEKNTEPIPERRPEKEKRLQFQKQHQKDTGSIKGNYPIWRCRVCGYLCARNEPPQICPICKASQDRFEEFKS